MWVQSLGREDPLEENGNPLQCSWLENPIDREAWGARVLWVAKSWILLKQLSMHACKSICCKTQWHSFTQKVFSKVPCTQYCAKYSWGDMRGTHLDTPSRSFQPSTWIREQSGRNLWVLQKPTAAGFPQSKTEGVREPRREGERKYDQERNQFFCTLILGVTSLYLCCIDFLEVSH